MGSAWTRSATRPRVTSPPGSGDPPAPARPRRQREQLRPARDQPGAQADIRRAAEQAGAELLELVLLRCCLRRMKAGELCPDQYQGMALELGFLDARALSEVAGGPLLAAQLRDELRSSGRLAGPACVVGGLQVQYPDRAHQLPVPGQVTCPQDLAAARGPDG